MCNLERHISQGYEKSYKHCIAAFFSFLLKILVLSNKHFDINWDLPRFQFMFCEIKKPLGTLEKQELFPRRWSCVDIASWLYMTMMLPPTVMERKINKLWLRREKLFKVNMAWINLKVIMIHNSAYFEWVCKVWKGLSLHRACL